MARKKKPDPEIALDAAAALLGIEQHVLERFARDGHIPHVVRGGESPGGFVYFRARELGRWLESNGVAPRNGEGKLLMSPRQVAQMTGLSVGTLEGLRLRNRGPKFCKVGKERQARVYYSRASVVEWIAKQMQVDLGQKMQLSRLLELPQRFEDYDEARALLEHDET